MTFNTGNPIGSTDARDRLDNSENLDLAVNSLSQTFVDRLGVTRDTLEGIYQKSAYYRAGTFDAGYTLTNNRQTLAYGNIEYSWSGVFPKVVSAGSTPASSGGVGTGAWVDRTDSSIRSELSEVDGEKLMGHAADIATLRTTEPTISSQKITVIGYYSTTPLKGGGTFYYDNTDTTSPDDGGMVIVTVGGKRWKRRIRFGSVSFKNFGALGDGSTDDYAAITKAIAYSAKGFELTAEAGIYCVSSPLQPQAGVSMHASVGTLTSGYEKVVIKAIGSSSYCIDAQYAKWAKIGGFNLDGNGIASRCLHGKNVFGLTVEDCRAINYLTSGFELNNDGTGNGCYLNELRRCHASGGVSGFVLSAASGYQVNSVVFDHCSVTDTSGFGFLEYSTGTLGRNVSYMYCDAEKTPVGFSVKSRSFNLTGCYAEFCTSASYIVDGSALIGTSQLQGGAIIGCSSLGSLAVGAPVSASNIGVSVINAYNVSILGGWFTYGGVGVAVDSYSRYINIDTFVGNNTNDYSISTKYYSIKRGNQSTRALYNISANATIGPDVNLVNCNCGNSSITATISSSSFLVGESVELQVMMTSANTGSVTVDVGSGVVMYGNLQGSTTSSQTITLYRGQGLKLIKQASGTWYAFSYLGCPAAAQSPSAATDIATMVTDFNSLLSKLKSSGLMRAI